MTEQERMLSGALYNAGDPALLEARQRAKCLCHRFNTQSPEDNAYVQHQQETLQALLGHVGTQCWIEAPFHCDYGTQITIGDHFFANYDCIFLDVAPIVIGNHVFLGLGSAFSQPDTRLPPRFEIWSWSLENPLPLATASGLAEIPPCCRASPLGRKPWWPPGLS